MTITIEELLERALLRALDQTVQAKAAEGFQHVLDKRIRWEKKKAGFKK